MSRRVSQLRVRRGGVGAIGLAAWLASMFGCSQPVTSDEILRAYPISDLEGLVTRSGVEFDREISSDGNGSLRLVASGTTTFRLYEVSDVDVEDARLVYRGQLRSQDLAGKAYLEMWCSFDALGDYFSRALHDPIVGTTDWTTQLAPFFLEEGQNPDRIRLNVVVEGTGTVWVDDVVLSRGPR